MPRFPGYPGPRNRASYRLIRGTGRPWIGEGWPAGARALGNQNLARIQVRKEPAKGAAKGIPALREPADLCEGPFFNAPCRCGCCLPLAPQGAFQANGSLFRHGRKVPVRSAAEKRCSGRAPFRSFTLKEATALKGWRSAAPGPTVAGLSPVLVRGPARWRCGPLSSGRAASRMPYRSQQALLSSDGTVSDSTTVAIWLASGSILFRRAVMRGSGPVAAFSDSAGRMRPSVSPLPGCPRASC